MLKGRKIFQKKESILYAVTMPPFNSGTAELSIRNDFSILPIKIECSFKVFPRTSQLPKIYDFKGMRGSK